MKRITWLAGYLFLQVFLYGGGSSQSPDSLFPDSLSAQTLSGPEEAVLLIDRLWASGFFQKCESIREEFLNNEYAFFDPKGPLARLEKRGMACYSRGPGRKDTIFLREDIFAHFKVGLEGIFVRSAVDVTVLKVLVHELCHDFWANLLDERERAYFAVDGGGFIEAFRTAMNMDDRRDFLNQAGQEGENAVRSRFLADLEVLIASYPPDFSHGPELFAWLGERAFSTDTDIPPVFRTYFAGIIAAAAPRHAVPSSSPS